MRHALLSLSAALVLLHAGCAASEAPTPAADAPREADLGEDVIGVAVPEHAPAPFTAKQIREATQNGRTYYFAGSLNGEAGRQRIVFSEVDAEGATLTLTVFDAEGNAKGGPMRNRVTWAELESHGRHPGNATTITEVELETPAGRFDCKRYEVKRDGMRAILWFATSLPGAPVKTEIWRDGKLWNSLELLEHTAGE